MQVQLNNLKERSLARIHQAESREDIEGLRVKILGRKGELTILLQGLPGLGDDERRSMGVLANQVKDQITHAIEARKRELLADRFSNLAETERIDVTLPGHPPPQGHLHLVTQAIREIAEIFEHMEFTRARYPEVEWDYFAFEALNMPSDTKIKGGQTKYILKKAVEGIIPDEIIWRKKQGFGTPIGEWLKDDSPISKKMTDVIMGSGLRERNILDYGYVEKLLSSHKKGKTDQSFKIWNLTTLSLWYDRWFTR